MNILFLEMTMAQRKWCFSGKVYFLAPFFQEKCIIYTMYRKIEQYIRNHLITVAIYVSYSKNNEQKAYPTYKEIMYFFFV